MVHPGSNTLISAMVRPNPSAAGNRMVLPPHGAASHTSHAFPNMRFDTTGNPARNQQPRWNCPRNFEPRMQWPPERSQSSQARNGGPRFPTPSNGPYYDRSKESRFSIMRDQDQSFDFDAEQQPRCAISPDRRTNFSFDGSYVSDSVSSKTDTDSSSRGTPVSWESPAHQTSGGTGRGLGQHSSHSQKSRKGSGREYRDSDSAYSSEMDKPNSVGSDRVYSNDGSTWRRPHDDTPGKRRDGASSSPARSGDKEERHGVKRHWDDDHDSDSDWIEREWRPAFKRLRPDSQELKARAEKAEAEANNAPEDPTPSWIRSSPADLYFQRSAQGFMEGTQKMRELEDTFEDQILKRAERVRATFPTTEMPPPPPRVPRPCSHHHHSHSHCGSSSSSASTSCTSSESDSDEGSCSKWMEEMERKRKHPLCLHPELWYNDPGEMNNGPLCRCSIKARRSGIRHDIYPGEKFIEECNPLTNNMNHLHHYRITMSPSTNFLSNSPSVIEFDNHEFIFEGFSFFTHEKLENVPLCKVIRFHIEYTIHFFEEPVPENFTVRSLDLANQFLFREILELVDMDWKGFGSSCNRFHLMPRFARSLPENGKEILSMNEVLKFLLTSANPLVSEGDLPVIQKLDKEEWQNWVDVVCGMIVTHPGKKPSSIRVDQLDRTKLVDGESVPPILVHFGIRPAQLSYAGDPAYQKAWKQYIKFKHLLNSKPKVTREDKLKLKIKESQLQEIQLKSTMKREVTVEMSSQGFLRTGLKSDICQHALLLPVLISHIRFHNCLTVLEKHLQYNFNDRTLLQLAMTHTSFRTNYGTNSAHARNSLTNCGLRQVEYGDRRVYYQNTRKRGINILVDIMSRMGKKEETLSEIPHNERLEFLGDAVVEFLSSVHLFYMFPWLEEGGLSTYRTAIVQNQHLAVLAKNLRLHDFMLYVHGPDLCHESDLRHAMANCFEALMGALFLDGGLDVVDGIFGRTLFGDEDTCLRTWLDLPLHPLQEDEPGGDRHWIESSPALQKLMKFEGIAGLKFTHIRLLAKAFTHRNVGYNLLTMGHNQRLEFLGDTVLQLIASEYLYRHFPEHHEGHLSLLRSSLVNGRTQAIVCDDLGMIDYVIYSNVGSDKFDMKTKQKADLLEAFLGSLYVDSGMDFCKTFCDVCFFPRLKDFILNQDWNDPKSQLQQCCLTLRKMGGGEPDIPMYKVIESLGPSNTRKYVVAVYFRGERLATGTGHSIQQAEMSAATNALKLRSELFPILLHQRRFLERRHTSAPTNASERNQKPRQYRNNRYFDSRGSDNDRNSSDRSSNSRCPVSRSYGKGDSGHSQERGAADRCSGGSDGPSSQRDGSRVSDSHGVAKSSALNNAPTQQ